ncbi:class I SAM-dependent methyltransferase [Catenuloplanes atrovinosus]|uniref:SAM-dependent methyltransferase n=1 Tax=Catenuloplanes atrovinosus TaxID=137266 RepID=A0AAE3YR09_9ACTN|nr:class I SAM-dependent methyltransferase [Catenuloplanes atrovinosus]MDR7278030.1 SAM-dependent methyltransferase [Catenuloplanes atrovinosus]
MLRYAFDNDDPAAADRHRYLTEMYDGGTAARLSALGDLAGRRCLELGAGGGGIARWLAGRGASVLATDVNVRHLPAGAGYHVLRHDVVTEPLPPGEWDVIHARLLLMHLPEREEVLRRLAGALAPGGVLLLEDLATRVRHAVLAAPEPADEVAFETYLDVLTGRVLPALGNDPGWALRVHAAMLAAGLTGVDTEVHARSWPGGTAGALLNAANIAQQRDGLRSAGLDDGLLDRVTALMSDPRMVIRAPLLYSTAGRRR